MTRAHYLILAGGCVLLLVIAGVLLLVDPSSTTAGAVVAASALGATESIRREREARRVELDALADMPEVDTDELVARMDALAAGVDEVPLSDLVDQDPGASL